VESVEEKISRFKLILAKTTDVEEAWNYFFNCLMPDDRFRALGNPVETDEVTPILRVVATQTLHEAGHFTHYTAIDIPEYGLQHGACFIDGYMVGYCLAKEMRIATACFVGSPDQKIHIIRFTVIRESDLSDDGLSRPFMHYPHSHRLH
jgi:hypothetical protein